MSDEDQEVAAPTDKYLDLLSSWNSFEDVPFNEWIINVTDSYFRAGLGLKFSANLLGVRPAELQAALNLGDLDEDDLALLARLRPPRTTWFSLAAATTEALEAAIVALEGTESGQSPFAIVEAAMRTISGPSSLERVASLSSDAFGHAAKKAEAYGKLSDKSRKALKGFQTNKRTGKALTSKQAAYAKSLLVQLADSGAIRRDSADGDQAICDEILDAIQGES